MLALLDADSIIFGCGFAVEHNYYTLWNKDVPVAFFDKKRAIPKDNTLELQHDVDIEPLENCLHLVKSKIHSILEATNAYNDYKVYIKGKGNFREQTSVTRVYKGNRDATHRPKYEPEIREYLINVWKAEVVDGMEVDDKVTIEQLKYLHLSKDMQACSYNVLPSGPIICTGDKDLDQVPGWHYNYISQANPYWVTEEEAIKFFYTQLLTGDASDNIQGIPKVGPKKAEKILEGCKTPNDLFRACKKEYEAYYKEEAEVVLLEMGQLLHLCRYEGDRWKFPVIS